VSFMHADAPLDRNVVIQVVGGQSRLHGRLLELFSFALVEREAALWPRSLAHQLLLRNLDRQVLRHSSF